MLDRLEADILCLVATTPAQACKLSTVNRGLAATLRSAVEKKKIQRAQRVKWRKNRLLLRLHVNAPHCLRLTWRSFGTTKELRMDLTSFNLYGQNFDGTINFDLSGLNVMSLITTNKDITKVSSRSHSSAIVSLSPEAIRLNLAANRGHRLPNGGQELVLAFSTPPSLYDELLSLILDPRTRARYAAPARMAD